MCAVAHVHLHLHMNIYKHVVTLIHADTYTHMDVTKRKKEKHEGNHRRKAELSPKSKMGCRLCFLRKEQRILAGDMRKSSSPALPSDQCLSIEYFGNKFKSGGENIRLKDYIARSVIMNT